MENNPAQNKQLLAILYDILREHRGGIKEYDLLVLLKKRELPVFSEGSFSDTLTLFRAHFMLFHLLFILQDDLQRAKKGIVEIHFLRIVLLPWQPVDQKLPAARDTLAEYYADLGNMSETDKIDVDKMIDQFWRDYMDYHLKPESFLVLGLSQDATRKQIKQRYRELAKSHHPDHGGDAAQFKRISAAAHNLLG